MYPILRKYTHDFGDKISKEHQQLIQRCPRIEVTTEGQNAIEPWLDWEWEHSWESAKLSKLVVYLYGAKSLRVPAEWRPHLPTMV